MRFMDQVRPEYAIAIEFLRINAHKVSEFSEGTHHCIVDGICVSDLGVVVLAQMYGQEWVDYLEESRFAEQMEPRKIAALI